MTYGTFAAIFKVTGLTGSRTLAGLHDSGSTVRIQWLVRDQALQYWSNSFNVSSNHITSTSDWYFAVTRKSTGGSTPRSSVYSYTNDSWAHSIHSAGQVEATAPGSSGTIRIESAGAEQFDGDIAVRAAWSNALPWAADTTGDAILESSGLPFNLMAWYAAVPSALWVFDQSDTTQNILDLVGGGASQSSLSGTSVSTNSVPTFSYGADLAVTQTADPLPLPPDLEEGSPVNVSRSQLRFGA